MTKEFEDCVNHFYSVLPESVKKEVISRVKEYKFKERRLTVEPKIAAFCNIVNNPIGEEIEFIDYEKLFKVIIYEVGKLNDY